jgi:subfamily B ATP-binding cassette protein MsbA
MSLRTMPDARQAYFRLISYIGRYKAAFAFGVFGAILFALAQASFTFAARPFLDGSFVQRDPRMLKLVPLGVIAIFLVRGTGDFNQT